MSNCACMATVRRFLRKLIGGELFVKSFEIATCMVTISCATFEPCRRRCNKCAVLNWGTPRWLTRETTFERYTHKEASILIARIVCPATRLGHFWASRVPRLRKRIKLRIHALTKLEGAAVRDL